VLNLKEREMKNSDMPAMPTFDKYGRPPQFENSGLQITGLTKREHFAGLAMQGCRARGSDYLRWSDLAKDAVEIADALLAELDKSNEPNK
jgi:hypothetical protein